MREIINLVNAKHPQDNFFALLSDDMNYSSQARALYRTYDRALSILDPASWNELSQKAINHFTDHRKGQLKQGFFNQFNEAFAYQFLIRQGYSDVAILPENGKKFPIWLIK